MVDFHLPYLDIEVNKVTLQNFASDKETLRNKLEIHFQKRFLGELDKIVSENDATDLKKGNFRVFVNPSETGLQALQETELYLLTRFQEGCKQIGYRIIKISPMDSFDMNAAADAAGNSILPTDVEKYKSLQYDQIVANQPDDYEGDVCGRSILVEGMPNATRGESLPPDSAKLGIQSSGFMYQTPNIPGASFLPPETHRLRDYKPVTSGPRDIGKGDSNSYARRCQGTMYSRLEDVRIHSLAQYGSIAESSSEVPLGHGEDYEDGHDDDNNVEDVIGTHSLIPRQFKSIKSNPADSNSLPHNTEVGKPELCTTISVTGYENVEPLLGYFSKNISSGGGKIASYYEDHMTKTLYITYQEPDVVRTVTSRTHQMGRRRLTVTKSVLPKQSLPRPVDDRRLLLHDLPETSTPESIMRFMRSVLRSDYPQVTFGSVPESAIVTNTHSIRDIDSVIDTIRRTSFEGKRISVDKVFRTDTILVKGLKETTDVDSIKYTFERPDVDEEVVKHVRKKTSRIALVYFRHVEDAEQVLNEHNNYTLGGERLSIAPFYEGIGVPVEMPLPNPFINEVSWSIMDFIFSNTNHKEALMLEMSKEAAVVIWPYGDDNRKAIIEPRRNLAHVSWADWEMKSRLRFEKNLKKYCGDKFPIPRGVEERVCKEWLNRLTSSVKTNISQSIDGQRYIILCGLRTDVTDSKYRLETFSKGGNVSLPQPQVTTVTMEMKPYQVQLLELCGVKDKLQRNHPRVQITLLDNSPAQCSIQFRGHRDDIRDVRLDMRDFLDNIPSKKVEFHPSQVQLMLRSQQHVFKTFQGKNVFATFVQDSDTSIMIYGKTDVAVNEAHQVIREVVCFERVPCTGNVLETLQSQSGENFMEEMNKKYALCVVSFEVEKQRVNIAAFKEELSRSKKALLQFIEDNTIEEVSIQCPEDKLQYLEHCLKVVHSVKLPPGVKYQIGNDVIILRGRPGDIREGQSHVSDFLSKVVQDYHAVNNSGIQDIPQDGIQQIQQQYNCKIDAVDRSAAAASGGTEVKRIRAPYTSPKIKSRYNGPNGQEFLVCHGDITKERVDGLVNAANERLQHVGGVAAAFVREGGESIQRECDAIRKRDGPLPTSKVVCTGPGKLPCKVLLHVVGPVYKDGYCREADQLHDAVTKVLREADRSNLGTIAMPAISSGIFGFPIEECTATIISSTMVYFSQNEESTITEVRFTDTAEAACLGFQTTLKQFATEISVTDDDEDTYGPKTSARLLSLDSSRARINQQNQEAEWQSWSPRVTLVSSDTISTTENMNITIKRGNIADQKADIIVNTVNVDVGLSHGKVSSAILSVAGKALQKECNTKLKHKGGRLRHWQFLTTGPAKLNCQAVYHLSCGNYDGNNVAATETSAIEELLTQANQDGMSSIAIPAIGTGNLGYPPDQVARLMYAAVILFSRKSPGGSLRDVRFIIYQRDAQVIQAFQQEMKNVLRNKSIRAMHPIAGMSTKSTKAFDNFNIGPDGVGRIKVGNIQVLLQTGNIVEAGTDCLVNSTSSTFELNRPLSKAIVKAGGKQVEQECKATGVVDEFRRKNIVMTNSGTIPRTQKIIHVLVSEARDPYFQKKITKCLRMAGENQMRSIAFPALGTGQASNKVREVAEDLLNAIGTFANTNPKDLNLVKIVIYQPQHFADYRDAMKTVMARGYCKQRTGKLKSIKKHVPGLKSVSKKHTNTGEDISSICFHIFADSKKNLQSAKDNLDDLIQEQFTTKPIPYNADCVKLTDGRKKRLQEIAEKHKTWLDFSMTEKDIKFKCIIVGGRKENILEVTTSLPTTLSEFQQDDEINRKVQWCYKDEANGGAIVPYEEDINASIEKAFQIKKDFIDLENEDGEVVRIDLKNFEEINPSSSQYEPRVRVIRRDLTQDDATRIPDDWDPNIDNEEKVLDPSSAEYQDIKGKFHASFPVKDRKQIVSIKQIRYRLLYRKYQLSKQAMMEKYPAGPQVERDLYHGTSDDTCQRIIKEGFNRSFHGKNGTAYGRGTYFARDAKYSARYTNASSNGHKHMFQCKVLTGEYCKGDQPMLAPPIRPQADDRYDSLVDNPQNPTIFVIFGDDHAYPEYLITFL